MFQPWRCSIGSGGGREALPHVASWRILRPGCGSCRRGCIANRADFFIDPMRAVDRAVITHAHSDHARPGHRAVLANADTLALMRARLGEGRAGETQQALALGRDG